METGSGSGNNPDFQERLRLASSIMRDGELSTLIAEDAQNGGAAAGIPALDLEFAVFTLLLIKLTGQPRGMRTSTSEASSLSSRIKDVLARETNGAAQAASSQMCTRKRVHTSHGPGQGGDRAPLREAPVEAGTMFGLPREHCREPPVLFFRPARVAYQEAHTALMERTAREANAVVWAADTRKTILKKRMSPELEKRLLFAIQTRDKLLARSVVFDEVGMRDCDSWLMIEVKQAAEYIAGMIMQHGDTGASPRSTLALENSAELLGMALNGRIPPRCAACSSRCWTRHSVS